MQESLHEDLAIPKRPRKKFACSKCDERARLEALPQGWLLVWDDKLARFVHYCLKCQSGKRSRKKIPAL